MCITSSVIQEWLISTEGEEALMTASLPPEMVMGFPFSPETLLTIWSVYVPSASEIVSPATATFSASDRVYTSLSVEDLEPGSDTTMYVVALA